jgi:hypothetical protein
LLFLGDYHAAREHVERAVAICKAHPDRPLRLWSSRILYLSEAAYLLWLVGYPCEALRKGREVRAITQRLPNESSRVVGWTRACRLYHFLRDGRAALELADTALAALSAIGRPF